MDTILHIKPEVNAVLLINGTFVERADNLRVGINEALYVTVLPLDAMYLPYTVKLVGNKPVSNPVLCACYALSGGHVLVRLKPRLNYVYSPASAVSDLEETGLVPRFFRFVKEGALASARGCMTKELSAGLSDEALADFFDEYADLTENTFTGEGGWFLLKNEGEGARTRITLRSGLIDNIEELGE